MMVLRAGWWRVRRGVPLTEGGFPTYASCEGHVGRALPTAWVDIEFFNRSGYAKKAGKLKALAREFNSRYGIPSSHQIRLMPMYDDPVRKDTGLLRIQTLDPRVEGKYSGSPRKPGIIEGMEEPKYVQASRDTLTKFSEFVRGE